MIGGRDRGSKAQEKRFGRLGRDGSEFVDQLAASEIRGRDRGCTRPKKRYLQGTPATYHLSQLSGCHLASGTPGNKLAVRDRRATRGAREEERGLLPMAWDEKER